MKIRFSYVILVFLLAGCNLYGRDFSSTQVKNIQNNVTTQSEIFGMFGEPVQKGLESGYDTWTYAHQSYSFGEGLRTKNLYIVFNKDNTVRSYSFTSN
jgi:hypothetical protein